MKPEYFVIVTMVDRNRYVYSFFSRETAERVANENKKSEIVIDVVITKVM